MKLKLHKHAATSDDKQQSRTARDEEKAIGAQAIKQAIPKIAAAKLKAAELTRLIFSYSIQRAESAPLLLAKPASAGLYVKLDFLDVEAYR